MPYCKIEPSGCGIHKDRVKLRLDFFLNPNDPNYDKAHAFVVDETCPEFLAGYQGKLDAEGNPDPVVYDKWRDGLPHVWRDNPFHHHFIYPDKEATDNQIKEQMEQHQREQNDSIRKLFNRTGTNTIWRRVIVSIGGTALLVIIAWILQLNGIWVL